MKTKMMIIGLALLIITGLSSCIYAGHGGYGYGGGRYHGGGYGGHHGGDFHGGGIRR